MLEKGFGILHCRRPLVSSHIVDTTGWAFGASAGAARMGHDGKLAYGGLEKRVRRKGWRPKSLVRDGRDDQACDALAFPLPKPLCVTPCHLQHRWPHVSAQVVSGPARPKRYRESLVESRRVAGSRRLHPLRRPTRRIRPARQRTPVCRR